MHNSIFQKDKHYTFSDYFNFNLPSRDIINALGYSFSVEIIEFTLETDIIDPKKIKYLQHAYYEVLPKINLTSEMSKREFMIAPVLWELIRHIEADISIEYPLKVNDRLSGTLDYFIRSKQNMVIIEAKKSDLENGFNQLSAELIALDIWQNEKKSIFLYGAVSVGEIWRFAILDRKKQHIIKDIHTYRVPEDISDIFSIMLGILGKAND